MASSDTTIPHAQTGQTGYSACSFTPIKDFCFNFWQGWDADTGRTLQDWNTAGSLHYTTPQKLSRPALTQREHPSIHTPLLPNPTPACTQWQQDCLKNWHISLVWWLEYNVQVLALTFTASQTENKAQLYTVVRLWFTVSQTLWRLWKPPAAALLPPALQTQEHLFQLCPWHDALHSQTAL